MTHRGARPVRDASPPICSSKESSMPETFEVDKCAGTLLCRFENDVVRIEPWGSHSLRVRASRAGIIRDDTVSALLMPDGDASDCAVAITDDAATLRNGQLEVRATRSGQLSFRNTATGMELLREKAIHALTIPARSYADLPDGAFKVELCFEAIDGEHLYGLGQHQNGRLDQKGCVIDLVQRNTEVS